MEEEKKKDKKAKHRPRLVSFVLLDRVMHVRVWPGALRLVWLESTFGSALGTPFFCPIVLAFFRRRIFEQRWAKSVS